MKTMTCRDLGGPCDHAMTGETADEVINLQDKHLKNAVAAGDTAHVPARQEMRGRWRNPVKGLGWYRATKKTFTELPED